MGMFFFPWLALGVYDISNWLPKVSSDQRNDGATLLGHRIYFPGGLLLDQVSTIRIGMLYPVLPV